MRFSTTLVFASLALTGFAAPNAKRTVAQVETDIAKISTDVNTLISAITAFGNSKSLVQALAIHTDATTLTNDINTGTTDVKATPTPIAEADGQAILTAVGNLQTPITTALNDITGQKANIAALPIGGIPALVCQDLKNLQTATAAFAAALVASAPADLKAQATTLANTINGELTTGVNNNC